MRVLLFHEPRKLLLHPPRVPCTLKTLRASEIEYDILGLSKVHLLERISHLDFHVFDHSSSVADMRGRVVDGGVLFKLWGD